MRVHKYDTHLEHSPHNGRTHQILSAFLNETDV